MHRILLSLFVFLAPLSAAAQIIDHVDFGGTFTDYRYGIWEPAYWYDFERAEFYFDPINADTLTMMDFGDSYIDVYSQTQYINVSVFVVEYGQFLSVWASELLTEGRHLLRDIFADPITFTPWEISGLRIEHGGGDNSGNIRVLYDYPDGPRPTYTLSTSSVPEPASLALLGLGLAGLGFAGRKQFK